MKRIITSILTITLLLTAATVVTAEGAITTNKDHHFYYTWSNWASPVNSVLSVTDTGYERAEFDGAHLHAEQYDRDFNYISGQTLSLDLPIFGGVCMYDDYNFVVSGQQNYEQSDDREVIRVTRYTKNWERIDSTGLFGANTTVPFDAGSLRFARCGDMLYIRTCHEMYASDDDCVNHQANLTMSVRISDMTVTDEYSIVMNSGYGYASHSFNQFIQVDGTDLLAVDHGDAYPRSVALFKYNSPAGQDTFTGRVSYVEVFPIAGNIGANYTGVAVGGFEYSDTHYLVAGNSVDQSTDGRQRNIFVTSTAKDNFTSDGTTVRFLTSHAEGSNVNVSPPHLVKISGDRFLILWTEDGTVRYAFLNGAGEQVSETYTSENSALSDCVPVVDGDQVVWYVTDNSTPVFYRIDLNTPEDVSHPHAYGETGVIKVATKAEKGVIGAVCTVCGEADEAAVSYYYLGDVTKDGKVNLVDVTAIIRYNAGWYSPEDDAKFNFACGDVTEDGYLNLKDVVYFIRSLAGFDDCPLLIPER